MSKIAPVLTVLLALGCKGPDTDTDTDTDADTDTDTDADTDTDTDTDTDADYFVDPGEGDDASDGRSRETAWRSPPGSYTPDGAAWLSPSWGAFGVGAPLPSGATVELKAGTALSAEAGFGRVVLDDTFYTSGSPAHPTTLRVSADWGDGPVILDASGMDVPRYHAALLVMGLDHVEVAGSDASRRLVIRGSSQWGLASYGSGSVHQQGLSLGWLEVAEGGAGVDLGWTDGFAVSDSIAHDNQGVGFSVGAIDDATCLGGALTDCEAHHNGTGDYSETGGIQHGFGLWGSSDIRYTRCAAWENTRDGFDFGTATNTADHSALVVDSTSWANGEDGFGCNGGTGSNICDYVNTVAWGNGQAGWDVYDGGHARLLHVVAHHNGAQRYFGGNIMVYSQTNLASVTVRNSIGYAPMAHANVYSYNSQGAETLIDSDHNLWVPAASDEEVFAETPYGVEHTYLSPPAWLGEHDQLGVTADPGFASTSTMDLAANDYHVSAGSSAEDAGLLLAAPAETALDLDGHPRFDPPDIGLYELP